MSRCPQESRDATSRSSSAGGAHSEKMRYRVGSASVEGPAGDIIAAGRPIAEERLGFEGGYTFFQSGPRISLPTWPCHSVRM